MQLTPPLQGSLIIVGRIHIQKAQTFRIEAADYVLVNLTGLNFIEKIYRPQFTPVQLSLEQRQHRGAVDGVQRLKPVFPERYHDVVMKDLGGKVRNQCRVQKGHITGSHETKVSACGL